MSEKESNSNTKNEDITIKKLKDSWNREEVIELIKQFNNDKPEGFDASEWIEDNL